jgi:hypothetical protein
MSHIDRFAESLITNNSPGETLWNHLPIAVVGLTMWKDVPDVWKQQIEQAALAAHAAHAAVERQRRESPHSKCVGVIVTDADGVQRCNYCGKEFMVGQPTE